MIWILSEHAGRPKLRACEERQMEGRRIHEEVQVEHCARRVPRRLANVRDTLSESSDDSSDCGVGTPPVPPVTVSTAGDDARGAVSRNCMAMSGKSHQAPS